jgi:hypothetical protein
MSEELEVIFPTGEGVAPIQYKKIPVAGKSLTNYSSSFSRNNLTVKFVILAIKTSYNPIERRYMTVVNDRIIDRSYFYDLVAMLIVISIKS